MEDSFNWFSFNEHIVGKHLTGSRKAIAVAPSYIPKSGKKTLWTGYFWSGCAGECKRGLDNMGIGVIDVDNHECMTLGSIQTPDTKTLDNIGKGLVDWYASYLVKRREQHQKVLNIVVADVFFSKNTFIAPMCDHGFHVISRLRHDAVLFYPQWKNRQERKGCPNNTMGRHNSCNLTPPDVRSMKSTKGNYMG